MDYQNKPTSFLKERGRNGIEIIEGWKLPNQTFSVKRFIGMVPDQKVQKDTNSIANMLLEVLNNKLTLVDRRFSIHETTAGTVILEYTEGDPVILIVQPQETEEEMNDLRKFLLAKLNNTGHE